MGVGGGDSGDNRGRWLQCHQRRAIDGDKSLTGILVCYSWLAVAVTSVTTVTTCFCTIFESVFQNGGPVRHHSASNMLAVT